MTELKEVEKFFLEASAQTYAANAPKGTIIELPMSKVLHYKRGALLYQDVYYSPKGENGRRKSLGQTTIWHMGYPVWGMHYHGWWEESDERVIPFLKRALMEAYGNGLFCGGRGPHLFYQPEESPLLYLNWPRKNDFADFEGEERIQYPIKEGGKVLFWHAYRGIALV